MASGYELRLSLERSRVLILVKVIGGRQDFAHAGGRRKALTEEQVDAICGMSEEDQGITLKALKKGFSQTSN